MQGFSQANKHTDLLPAAHQATNLCLQQGSQTDWHRGRRNWLRIAHSSRCCHTLLLQVRIQDLVKGGGPASEAESCRHSEAESRERSEHSAAGVRARLRALEAFGFLMLKYAFSHILETPFLLFLTSILTPKVDKNRALDFTSINLRHSDMLHLFFNLHEKVML